MIITLIKKIRENGELCAKSARVLNELETLGLMARIDQIVTADARQPNQSEGYALAVAHNISTAPFFIVDADDGSTQIYTAYQRFLSEVLNYQTSEANEISEIMDQNPDLDFI